MEARRHQVKDCVRLWATTIPPQQTISWVPRGNKTVHASLFAGLLLTTINEVLEHHNLTPLQLIDLEESSWTKIEVNSRNIRISSSSLFTIVDEEDRLAVSEGEVNGDFPFILDRTRFHSNTGVIVYYCDLYPILTGDVTDPLPGFYQLDLVQIVKLESEQGLAYITEWLFRNRIVLHLGEFLPPSEATRYYQVREGLANFAINGSPRVASKVCRICEKPTQTICDSCGASYCGVECQKKDWIAGHKEKCK